LLLLFFAHDRVILEFSPKFFLCGRKCYHFLVINI
jgi:hypothetical protein